MSRSPFFLWHSLPCSLGEGLSLNLDRDLANPAGQQVLVIFLSPCYRALGLQNGPTTKVFLCGFGVSDSVLILARPGLYQMSHLPWSVYLILVLA